MGCGRRVDRQPVTLATLERIRASWDGPLLVKGVLRPEDVLPLKALGAQGVIVSNHGGRQIETAPSTIAALPDVVGAAGADLDVFLDGGVRRGTDVVKAIALGAKGVLVGRPHPCTGSPRGQAGVEDVLRILHDELYTAMALLGFPDLASIGPKLVGTGHVDVDQ